MPLNRMRKWRTLYFLGACFVLSKAREPFKPKSGSLPFLVYFTSRYRGLCVGTLISRTAVITAAVCVTSPISVNQDKRPINVVTGATYRHPRRGIRVQVTKILIPKLSGFDINRGYLLEKSVAILLLKRKVPDILAEIPQRAIDIDYLGEERLTLQEECFMPGWHFFYQGDKIYPVNRFLLQRNVRVQFLNVVKKSMWCEALSMKFQNALTNFGFSGYFDKFGSICVRDADRTAQPCHGMYGAPLICRGRAVGMLLAPDAQWTNCTGFSNIVHVFSSKYLQNFMKCVSSLFNVEYRMDWNSMKKAIYDDNDEDKDYVSEIYDKLDSAASSNSDEMG